MIRKHTALFAACICLLLYACQPSDIPEPQPAMEESTENLLTDFILSKTDNPSLKENIIILCGHYKGVDQRVRDHLITKEYTIGDFVLTGGEMPAAIMTDAIVRLLPGALGDVESALNDSFQDGLLEPGVYTRPAEYKGWRVPDILLSGNQAKIEDWLYEEALRHTRERRPDLLDEE